MNRLRILMYCSYFPPEYSGAALQAISLAKQLRAHGHHIEFITQRWPGLKATDEIDGFTVTRLAAGGSRKHRELRLWWNMAQLLYRRRGDFDILHSHGAYYTDSVIGPLGKWLGMRSFAKASLTQNDLRDLNGSMVGRVHRWMLRRVDACVAISRDLEQEFVDGGVSRERIHYLPNGVDLDKFVPASPEEKRALRHELGLPADRALILYVGVFDERKNISWLLREWRRSGGFGLKAMLLAIGPQSREDPDGTFKQRLVELAREAPDLLRVEGESKDVVSFYRAADLFIMPSLSEGLPNAVLEAMACGLPIAAANVSGTRELVVEGETGFLFQLGDQEALGRAITAGLGEGAAAVGAAGRQRVERDFDIRSLARRYEALYDHVRAR